MCVKRSFHPIGQGAFYSEQHQGFNVVYDCGNTSKSGNQDSVVTDAFSADTVIDILFISHFDYDHVSKIRVLMAHCAKIKKVVLPLLHEEQKNLLSNVYRGLGQHVLTLINNPRKFFGPDTAIIEVEAAQPGTDPAPPSDPVLIDALPRSTRIPSGQPLTINSSLGSWVYVPYNHHFADRSAALASALAREGFEVQSLRDDPFYTCYRAIYCRGALRRVYRSLQGTVNENSLFVYSGPLDKDRQIKQVCHSNDTHPTHITQPGCIYTGDGNLNKVDIKSVFSSYWNNVGTIQVPHHGAHPDFNLSTLSGRTLYCPVSYGTRNSYKHPSSVLMKDIEKSGNHPIRVTEKNSGLVQHICWGETDPRRMICY